MTTYHKLNKGIISEIFDWETSCFIKFGSVIRFKNYDEITRYHVQMTPNETLLFNKNANLLYKQFLWLIEKFFGKEIIVALYDDIPGTRKPRTIKKEEMITTDDYGLLWELFYQAITHRAFPLFIASNGTIAMSPTDHLDIFVSYDETYSLSNVDLENQFEMVEWKK